MWAGSPGQEVAVVPLMEMGADTGDSEASGALKAVARGEGFGLG